MIVHLITEGRLELPIGEKIIMHCGHEFGMHYYLEGAGNVFKKAHLYMPLVKTNALVLILTDFIDTKCSCLPLACEKYLHQKVPPQGFLLRFAVNEIESWLLADKENMANFLHIDKKKMPSNVENIQDPKQTLVNLGRLSKSKAILQGIVPTAKGVVGKQYNAMLTKFIMDNWHIENAMENSESLRRCVVRLRECQA